MFLINGRSVVNIAKLLNTLADYIGNRWTISKIQKNSAIAIKIKTINYDWILLFYW